MAQATPEKVPEESTERVKTVEIDCMYCGRALRSTIRFGERATFDTATLIGNKIQCAGCGKMTACNKANMRVVFVDDSGKLSGHVGKDIRKG